MVWDCFDPQPHASWEEAITHRGTSGSHFIWQCDYDENCTRLFKSIEEGEWANVIRFLDTGSWPGFHLLPDFSPELQAKTYVTRYNESEGEAAAEAVWSYLPLHAAIIYGAPFSVIRRLVDVYPETARWPDFDGDTALHLALYLSASDKIVCYLMMNAPETINARAKDGCTPLQRALRAKGKQGRGIMLDIFVRHTKPHASPIASDDVAQAKVLERDYKTQCTDLFKRIENRDWDIICEFFETGEWSDQWFSGLRSFFGGKDSPDIQAKTWITRFSPNGAVKWSQLPLHVALVCEAPLAVIKGLVELYPKALRLPDDRSMLPLHLALNYHASDNVVAYLAMTYPDAVNKRGHHRLTPIELALQAEDHVRGEMLRLAVTSAKIEEAPGAIWVSVGKDETRGEGDDENPALNEFTSYERETFDEIEKAGLETGLVSVRSHVLKNTETLDTAEYSTIQGSKSFNDAPYHHTRANRGFVRAG